MPSFEEFTTTRPPTSPATMTPGSRVSNLEKVRRHSKKISDALTTKGGYMAVGLGGGLEREESRYEMQSLIKPGKCIVEKRSGESYSVGGSEVDIGERDSGKLMKI
jgi:hypothetical protein